MKKFFGFFLWLFLSVAFWFRYRVIIKGLESLSPKTLNKSGGILFLPNHPTVFVDPTLVTMVAMKRYRVRPVVVEYMYYAPIIHSAVRLVDALPIPNFNTSSNSLKRKRGEQAITRVVEGLRKGDNFLIYPAGRLKSSAKEVVGGASAVHRILEEAPETNVVLVRTKGLWGSRFSRALTGKTPPIFPTILWGIKVVLKNLLFFTPRRHVTIEFVPAPKDFPYRASRLELNRYLEDWYNQPDGLIPQTSDHPGDSLVLGSYSAWKETLSEVQSETLKEEEKIDLEAISDQVKDKIITKLVEMTDWESAKIQPSMELSTDLGLDSLDVAELGAFLSEQFDVGEVPIHELTTVGKVMAIAAKQLVFEQEDEGEVPNLSKWRKPAPKEKIDMAPGKTLPEIFLNNCARMGNVVACADDRAGILTYSQLKMRVILLAQYLQTLSGKHVGILLPASVAAYATVFACYLAGKVPVMINWTIGSRHIESVLQLSKMQVALSSWAFLDRLPNVELNGLEDLLIMLEDVRRQFTLKDKLKAFLTSKRSSKAILSHFGADKLKEEDCAVLLFTSGTEGMPKGVPLSHFNLISNQKSSLKAFDVYSNDIFYGILPPFHSFGFTVTGVLGLLVGMKVAYAPDPRDGKKLAQGVEKWGITIICGAPTFLKGMIKAAEPQQLKTLRFCMSGAEKAPPELFQLVEQIGKGNTLYEGYGITECSPVLTVNRVGKPSMGVGEPLPQVELCIVHPETHEVLSRGKQGLILARGPNVFSGYLNKDAASPFCMVEGKKWYQTGDLGYFDEEGRLVLSGRLKRFVKVGAEMISLAAIEEALIQKAIEKGLPVHKEGPTFAICAKEKEAGEKPKISLFTTFALDIDEVNQFLKEAGFSNLVRISSVHRLSSLPVMGTGKINYRELEDKVEV